MRYLEVAPGNTTCDFVDCFWMLEGSGEDTQRIVPDGRTELIVNLGTPLEANRNGAWERQPRRFFVGQLGEPMLVRPSGPVHILGVRFKPWGARAFLKAPMSELTQQTIAQDGFDVDTLGALENELRFASATDLAVQFAASEMIRRGGQVQIGRVADHVGMSTRQLERRFSDQVGLTPKTFCRIQRFQRVFHAMDEPEASWVNAAVSCGYYDQAHLIKDFRDFAGEAPSVLMRESSDLARHFLSHSSKTRDQSFL